MKIFNWRLIHKDDFAELQKRSIKAVRVVECHRWFAGWNDLDIIWDYILNDNNFGGITNARDKYAKARGTDVYGNQRTNNSYIKPKMTENKTVDDSIVFYLSNEVMTLQGKITKLEQALAVAEDALEFYAKRDAIMPIEISPAKEALKEIKAIKEVK